jgi:hypothetical protein
MSDEDKTEPGAMHRSETEILAQALADSNKEANSSNKNTVRVLGTLLAFSVLGNFALAGLNISGRFFGTDIQMGKTVDPQAAHFQEAAEELGYQDPDVPPYEWCVDAMGSGEIHPDDLLLCMDLYPDLAGE